MFILLTSHWHVVNQIVSAFLETNVYITGYRWKLRVYLGDNIPTNTALTTHIKLALDICHFATR